MDPRSRVSRLPPTHPRSGWPFHGGVGPGLPAAGGRWSNLYPRGEPGSMERPTRLSYSSPARHYRRYDITTFPDNLIGASMLRWSVSPSILTTRGWVCPVQFGNSDTNMEWVRVRFSSSTWNGPE